MVGGVAARFFRHPVRLVPIAFLAVAAVGTVLLSLPFAHPDNSVDVLAAAFTSMSATTVTGLTVVDTSLYWSPFGHWVIFALAQVGGFGIMSLATLLALLVRGRIELHDTLVAQTETQAPSIGDISALLRRVAMSMLIAESVVAAWLTLRYLTAYDLGFPAAVRDAVYQAGMSFTNAGFALRSDSLTGYVSDAWIIWPLCLAVVAGSLGFPVFFELLRSWRRPSQWSMHTRITFYGFMVLLLVGVLLFLAFEWTNPATLGPMDAATKINAGLTGGVMPRSGGFNAIDYGSIRDETLVITVVLMFIGGGSAGTSGGIKVSTFFLLAYLVVSEARGEREVVIGHRRVGPATQRQAVSVALLALALVTVGTILLVVLTDLPLDVVVFDVVSAFGTVGLSTGITPDLPVVAQVILMALMFVGRVGTITTASALALRSSRRRYSVPEDRPIVG